MSWQPIETIPKSLEELARIYGDDMFIPLVIIGRNDQPLASGIGVSSGSVSEAMWVGDRYIIPSYGTEYGWTTTFEQFAPTVWQPMPTIPKNEN